MYVYKRTEPQLWTVGYYESDGTWNPESDHDVREEAAKRVAYLNGKTGGFTEKEMREMREYFAAIKGKPLQLHVDF